MKNTMKGFTLAEILITLMIVGVVAAVTLPNISIDHKYQQLGVKLAKFQATIQEAASANTAMNEQFDSSDFESNGILYKEQTGSRDYILNDDTIVHFSNNNVPDGQLVAPYNNTTKYGDAVLCLDFEPNIQGLTTKSGDMKTHYTFHITNKGHVILTDPCVRDISKNGWKVNKTIAKNANCKKITE